jgi:hypothetical protein
LYVQLFFFQLTEKIGRTIASRKKVLIGSPYQVTHSRIKDTSFFVITTNQKYDPGVIVMTKEENAVKMSALELRKTF